MAWKFIKTINQEKKLNKKAKMQIRKNKPKMSKSSQIHAQYAFSSKFKQQKCLKIWKRAIRKTDIYKNKPKKQENFE